MFSLADGFAAQIGYVVPSEGMPYKLILMCK